MPPRRLGKVSPACATKTGIRHFTREKSCAGLMRVVGLLHKVLCGSYAVFFLVAFCSAGQSCIRTFRAGLVKIQLRLESDWLPAVQ